MTAPKPQRDVGWDPAELLFCCLWLLVILPKAAQCVLLAALAVYAILKNGGRLQPSVLLLSAHCAVYLFSVIYHTATASPESGRVLAAVNTFASWLFAMTLFCTFRTADDGKISKICYANIVILFALCCLSHIFKWRGLDWIVEVRHFWGYDVTAQGATERFMGLFEYAALVGFFVLLQLPLALRSVKNVFSLAILLITGFFSVFFTNSRAPIVCCAAVCLLSVYWYLRPQILKVRGLEKRLWAGITVVLVVVCVACYRPLWDFVVNIWNARPGSNSTRIRLYRETIRSALSSPVFGVGVKTIFEGVPLGSHSTPLGIFYKSGILGSLFFCAAAVLMLIDHIKALKKGKDMYGVYGLFCMLCVCAVFLVEDLDGTDWLIALFFTAAALHMNFAGGRHAYQRDFTDV